MEPLLSAQERAYEARARRYGVPLRMIEAATERRLAGDWRGACAAANFDTFDPHAIRHPELREQLLSDLAVLAPDLVRWHLPLHPGHETALMRRTFVLARYQRTALCVRTPDWPHWPQRLSLQCDRLEDAAEVMDWSASRHLWDATRADELRVRCGGNAERTPFFHANGTPLTKEELPDADPGEEDQAVRTEWLASLLRDPDKAAKALNVAGIEVVPGRRSENTALLLQMISREPLILTRLADELRRLGGAHYRIGSHLRYQQPMVRVSRKGLALTLEQTRVRGIPTLPMPVACRLPDIDLLLGGEMSPHDLHPLVRSALFPKLASESRTKVTYELEPVRVRCQGVWHVVEHRNGLLTGAHSEQEHRREEALHALGGVLSGCAKARQDWLDGNRLPRRLRAQRSEMFARVRHGDTTGVLRMLDAGFDARVRDGLKRNLMHYLHFVDHELLLGRLLAAGVDLEAKDHTGRTPLLLAIAGGASVGLVRALLAAGARIDAVDNHNIGLRFLIEYDRREDLRFLEEDVERQHGELGLTHARRKGR